MASGDVVLHVEAASVAVNMSGNLEGTTGYSVALTGRDADNHSVAFQTPAADAGIWVLGVPESPFDASKTYDVTIKEH